MAPTGRIPYLTAYPRTAAEHRASAECCRRMAERALHGKARDPEARSREWAEKAKRHDEMAAALKA